MSTDTRAIVLLDGSMGQELVNRLGKDPTKLWATQALVDAPDVVRELHADYIKAGATVVTVNTYSCTPERLQKQGVGDQFEKLQKLALRLVAEAREQSARADEIGIAGCLPPLVGSYLPELSPDYQASYDTYSRIVELQQDTVDCFLCETVSSITDAKAVAAAAAQAGKPVWVALSVSDEDPATLRSGEPLGEAQAVLSEQGIDSQLLNCSRPESIDAVFADFNARTKHTGAYANGFSSVAGLNPNTTVAVLETRKDLGPDEYAKFAMKWAQEGANLVGGCCEVGPAHIERLAGALNEAGFTLTREL